VLSGFDRLVFRGPLRGISYVSGRERHLWANPVRKQECGEQAEKVTEQLKEGLAGGCGKRQASGLRHRARSAKKRARAIAAEERSTGGLVCVLKSVEPCGSFDLHRNREQPKLEWGVRERQGLFLDHYWMQPVLGFRNARLQSWFPFPLQICRNGREWLARQRDGAGLSEVRQDHCFPWVENGARAQALNATYFSRNRAWGRGTISGAGQGRWVVARTRAWLSACACFANAARAVRETRSTRASRFFSLRCGWTAAG
jgi:hypothetical protein